MSLQPLAYADGDTALTGLLARPSGSPRAAVAVFPTFMNTSPGVEAKALALAQAGCVALVTDFYGPDAPHDAASAFGAVERLRADPLAMRRRLRASLAALEQAVAGEPVVPANQAPPVELPVGAVLGVDLAPVGVRSHAEPAGVAVRALPSVGPAAILNISEHAAAVDADAVEGVPVPYDRRHATFVW